MAESESLLKRPLAPEEETVWDRLWRAQADHRRDHAHLRREAEGPRWKQLLTRIRKTFGNLRGLRSIELGSGKGDFSALLARHGVEVTLLDRSDVAIDRAKERFDRLHLPATIIRGDLLRVPKELACRFDLALSVGVVEHFRGWERSLALESHLSVLRPGGLGVIAVPNASCLPYRLWKFMQEVPRWWPYGLEIPYGRGELLRRARHTGFVDLEVSASGFWHSVGLLSGSRIPVGRRDWSARTSCLDNRWGVNLVLVGRRPGTWRRTG